MLASGAASAGTLVNRGGTSDVPTYASSRVYYIKPIGHSCPSNFICFCDSGTSCTLPGTGTITGTVVIDRSGVTLDCQNRVIQPPRYAGSTQVCTGNPQCGKHSSGYPSHECVNGFCQLGNLGGINVGGPLRVDDGSAININVNDTGYVQNVDVVNCVVRNFASGFVVDGSTGDNGNENFYIAFNEFRTNVDGMDMFATDMSEVSNNYIHDNDGEGMDLNYNWSLTVAGNTSVLNGYRQLIVLGNGSLYNRWLNVQGNSFQNRSGYTSRFGSVWMSDLEGTGAACNGAIPDSLCDMYFDSNHVQNQNGSPTPVIEFLSPAAGAVGTPSVSFRGNTLINPQGGVWAPYVNISPDFPLNRRCWNKGNVCSNVLGTEACSPASLFAPGNCWY